MSQDWNMDGHYVSAKTRVRVNLVGYFVVDLEVVCQDNFV